MKTPANKVAYDRGLVQQTRRIRSALHAASKSQVKKRLSPEPSAANVQRINCQSAQRKEVSRQRYLAAKKHSQKLYEDAFKQPKTDGSYLTIASPKSKEDSPMCAKRRQIAKRCRSGDFTSLPHFN